MKATKRIQTIVLLLVWTIAVLTVPAYAETISTKRKNVSPEAREFLGKFGNYMAEVAEVTRPSVVNVSTTSTVTVEETPFGEIPNDPFFKKFFGEEPGGPDKKKKFKSQALGSGVIVSDDGYILTNNHVVQGAEEIKVIIYDKREFKGKIIGGDAKTDLAVIKINAKDLPVIKFGDSTSLKTGDIIFAVGSPFGLAQTVTMGIVSAVGRSNVGIADYEDFIQTDAAINPGNSGGALVNTNGELVGINTAIFSMSGGYIGIGFAIPTDMAKTVMESIVKNGKVIRGWLGISIQNLTPELAKSLGVKDQGGALVAEVLKGGPAEKAGFKRGDVIIDYDGKKIEDSRELRNMVASTPPGKSVSVRVIRDGKEETLNATVQEFQEKKAAAKNIERNTVLRGISVQELTNTIRQNVNIPPDVKGVFVTEVDQDSPAQKSVQRGDVIQEVNRAPVQTVEDFESAVSKLNEKDSGVLLIYRNGSSTHVTIKR